MSTDYERTFRAEVLKECLASVAGSAFHLGTKSGKTLAFQAGTLANRLLLPEYNNDSALDQAEAQYKNFKIRYENLKQGI